DSAIVLVGFVADEYINSIGVAGDIEGITLASRLYPKNEQNVLALHFRAGETFRLAGLTYMATESPSAYRYLTFEDLPSLMLQKPGIYYYGRFSSIKGVGRFSGAH